MAEYLAPGVHIEEYDVAPRPIPIDDATAQLLVESVNRIVKLAEPDWTGFNRSDPGITLIELCGLVAESLLYRAGHVSDARRDAAFRAFAPLFATPCASERAPLIRPRFFVGRLLDVVHEPGGWSIDANCGRDQRLKS